MKKHIQWICIAFLTFGVVSLHAQNKHYTKAKECYEDGKYEKAFRRIEKAKQDKNQTKDPQTYLLESKILLGLNNLNPQEQTKKDAVKAAIKAKIKADNDQFVRDNQAHYDLISQINIDEALNFYHNKRYSKAIVLFKRSLELGEDSFALYMLAKSYLLNKSNRNALPLLDELVNKQYANFQNNNERPDFMADAFNIYTGTLFQKQLYDSAEFYLYMGLEMFPTDQAMLMRQKNVWYSRLGQIPLSYTLFDFLDKATQTYRFDSVFTFKKNGVYLMFISNNIKNGNKVAADSWLQKILIEKMDLALMNPTDQQKKQDFFLEKDSAIIYEKMLFYFGNFKEVEAQKVLFNKYKNAKFSSSSALALKHLEGLFPAEIVSSLYKDEIQSTKSKPLVKQRYIWYQELKSKGAKKPSDYEALLAINKEIRTSANSAIMKKDYADLLSEYWKQSVELEDFWKAFELGEIADRENVESRSDLWKYTIQADFKVNYFGSRVLLKTPASAPYGYSWNGSTENCNPGFLPDSILKKVSKRINYFRREAHLTNPIGLMENYNRACQWAALFYTANNNLTHKLSPDLTCYTRGGAQAARLGLLTQGVHTSIAVTEFMNDNNPSAGNRRWLLYPPTQFMGFGCTDNQSVLQCVEEKMTWDTSTYINKGVAWPPEGYSPSIFAFKYWSYSGYQDFTNASISMTHIESGEVMPCRIQEIKNGYGMPCLVWQPKDLIRKSNRDASYRVIITLKNSKTISYIVHLVKVEL